MRSLRYKITSTLAAVVVLLAFIVAPASSQEPITWKCQVFWSASELSYQTFVDFTERVKELTDGRLIIKPYPGGAIVPTFEALDALQNNVIQAMAMWPGYFSGKEPAFAAISDMVAAYTNPWQKETWMYYKGGMEMLRKLYEPYDAYPVGIMFWGIESMVSTEPIRNMEDFEGLKMRVPQGMTAMLMQKLGASVVVLPGGEVYSSLDKGVINTSDWATLSMNHRMGFYEVAKYTNYPGFHSMPMGDFTVNMQEWNKLPDDIKEILTTATREWSWDSYERIAIDDIKVVPELKDMGVEIIQWSEEDLDRVREVSRDIWDEFAKKSPMAKKVIDSQKEWLKELGLIE
ncbi:MAG: TRAP transporter substrate-binding protein [Desulfohalobiaceae bacterium]|nr:TRAP transporter substrate-binding protein [Desulfohalobiaceae bacterium]